MASKQKLELTWLGKDKEIKIEPRILIEDKEKSNCKNDPDTENSWHKVHFFMLPVSYTHLTLPTKLEV